MSGERIWSRALCGLRPQYVGERAIVRPSKLEVGGIVR